MQQDEKRTLAFGSYMSCVILVHSEAAPSDKDWGKYIDFIKAQKRPETKILVVGKGGPPPSAAQRAKLATVFEKSGVPTAVLTDSQISRGVVTALNWIFPQKLAAFPTARLEDALIYVGLPVGIAPDIRKVITHLNADLQANKPL
jgi:hypothetical protein